MREYLPPFAGLVFNVSFPLATDDCVVEGLLGIPFGVPKLGRFLSVF